MRQLFVVTLAVVAGLALAAGPSLAGQVEVKGVHLCCNQCVKVAGGILAKVEGVSNAMCDREAKTVKFTAKDAKAATAGVQALLDGGFFGAATDDGKEVKVAVATPPAGAKGASVTIKEVHVCCNACRKIIQGLFEGTTIEYAGTQVQKEVKISGKDLDKAAVLETLRKAGFNGKVE
jgi:hypothetical protein